MRTALRRDRLRLALLGAVATTTLVALLWNRGAPGTVRRGATKTPVQADLPRDSPGVRIERAGPAADESLPDGPAPPRVEMLRGVVRERSTEVPVAGARIYASDEKLAFVRIEHSTESGADGRFALPFPAPLEGASATIHALAEGYVPWATSLSADGLDSPLGIYLDRGLALEGKVTDVTGSPVVGARVWAHRPVNRVQWPNRRDLLPALRPFGGLTVSDEEGRFVLRGLEAGSYELRAGKMGWTTLESETPRVAEAGTGNHDLLMLPVFRLCVRVVDEVSRTVLPGASVTFTSTPNLTAIGHAEYDHAVPRDEPAGVDVARGATYFALAASGSGARKVRILCSAPGYEAGEESIALEQQSTEVRVRLRPRTLAPRGSVRFRAEFESSDLPFDGLLSVTLVEEARTSARGLIPLTFSAGVAQTLVALPAGRYKYRVDGAGDVGFWWGPAATPGILELHESETKDETITLRGTQIDLVVVDGEGRPVRGFDLIVNPAFGRSGIYPLWDTPRAHPLLRRWSDGYSGPDLILPPGRSVVIAQMPELGRALANLELGASGERVRVRLPLVAD